MSELGLGHDAEKSDDIHDRAAFHRLTSCDRIAIGSFGVAGFSDGLGDVQWYRRRGPSPLIDERRPATWELRDRLEDEGEVFDRTLIDVELLVVEHAGCIGG